MKTTEQIKEEELERAREFLTRPEHSTKTLPEVVALYAKEVEQRAYNAALELAAEKAQLKRTNDSLEWKMIAEDDHFIEVSKNSILSLKINS